MANISILQSAEFEAAVHPHVLNIMVELQSTYNLPINIICGESLQELRMVKLRTTGFDEDTLRWFVNTAVNLEVLKSGGALDEAEEV